MSTRAARLSSFFSSFEFNRYKYDPSRDPAEEFERLCVARQWGSAKREKNFEGYFSVIGETSDQPLAIFFRKYNFLQFTYNPSADPEAEFARLQEARRWGEKKLTGVRKEFLTALEGEIMAAESAGGVIVETLPIVEFFKEHEVPGYAYRPSRPEAEFRRLVRAHRRIWRAEEVGVGNVVQGVEGWRRWRASTEFQELREGFYGAVEGQFDKTLDRIAASASGERALRRDEVMVELYGVGKAPLSEEEAETLLESVHVNIYDFLEVVGAAINAATESETRNLIQLLSSRARELNFPDDAMLAIYSVFMQRVFPRDLAERDGTLILLLRLISRYFHEFDRVLANFKREGGDDLAMAKEEGPAAVRRLLLSREWESLQAVRAIPSLSFARLRRARG